MNILQERFELILNKVFSLILYCVMIIVNHIQRRRYNVESYQLFWKNYFNVQGRTRRRHYWFATLANIIVLVLLSLLQTYLNGCLAVEIRFNIVYETIDVIIVIGTFTMSVRRFHDVGRTMLIPLIMLISMLLRGLIVLIETISNVYLSGFILTYR